VGEEVVLLYMKILFIQCSHFFFLCLHFPFQESVLILGLLILGFSCKRTVKSIETSV